MSPMGGTQTCLNAVDGAADAMSETMPIGPRQSHCSNREIDIGCHRFIRIRVVLSQTLPAKRRCHVANSAASPATATVRSCALCAVRFDGGGVSVRR